MDIPRTYATTTPRPPDWHAILQRLDPMGEIERQQLRTCQLGFPHGVEDDSSDVIPASAILRVWYTDDIESIAPGIPDGGGWSAYGAMYTLMGQLEFVTMNIHRLIHNQIRLDASPIETGMWLAISESAATHCQTAMKTLLAVIQPEVKLRGKLDYDLYAIWRKLKPEQDELVAIFNQMPILTDRCITKGELVDALQRSGRTVRKSRYFGASSHDPREIEIAPGVHIKLAWSAYLRSFARMYDQEAEDATDLCVDQL